MSATRPHNPVNHRLSVPENRSDISAIQRFIAQLQHKIAQRHTGILSTIALHEYMGLLQAELGQIHDALTDHYFHAYHDSCPPVESSRVEVEFAQ